MPPQQRKYYAVAKGRVPGIYKTWPECETQTKAFSGAKFKSFASLEQAQKYLDDEGGKVQSSSSSSGSSSSSKATVSSSSSENNNNSNGELNPLKRKECTTNEDADDKNSKKQKKTPQLDDDGAIYRQVYTDGCCFANGSADSLAGVGCFFGDGDPLNYSGYLEGPPSNQRAEIKAATIALQLLPGENYVEILTDSKYVINAATAWRFVWEKNDWKTSSRKEIQNLDLFKELIHEIDKKTNVKFTYVAGHTNIHGNEMADKLAKAGALS